MVFWHKGGNKLWNSVARKCKLFPSQRKYTGEAGIGLSPSSVSGSQKLPWWDRNLSLRAQPQIQACHPACLAGRGSSDAAAVGRGEHPSVPCATISGAQHQSDRGSELIQSPVCAFGRQCSVHFLWASWEICIDADKGKGDEQRSLCWESMCAEAVRAHLVSQGS